MRYLYALAHSLNNLTCTIELSLGLFVRILHLLHFVHLAHLLGVHRLLSIHYRLLGVHVLFRIHGLLSIHVLFRIHGLLRVHWLLRISLPLHLALHGELLGLQLVLGVYWLILRHLIRVEDRRLALKRLRNNRFFPTWQVLIGYLFIWVVHERLQILILDLWEYVGGPVTGRFNFLSFQHHGVGDLHNQMEGGICSFRATTVLRHQMSHIVACNDLPDCSVPVDIVWDLSFMSKIALLSLANCHLQGSQLIRILDTALCSPCDLYQPFLEDYSAARDILGPCCVVDCPPELNIFSIEHQIFVASQSNLGLTITGTTMAALGLRRLIDGSRAKWLSDRFHDGQRSSEQLSLIFFSFVKELSRQLVLDIVILIHDEGAGHGTGQQE